MGEIRSIPARPLTPEAYRPWGAVLAAFASGGPGRVANHGRALAFDRLSPIENHRPATARVTASVFRCHPLQGPALSVAVLERHPFSTQLFVPMNARRYLVVVAHGADRPDLETLSAFVADGAQAITYAPGVWHHPMVALLGEIDFVNLVCEDGSAGDCEEVAFEDPVARVLVAD